MQKEIHPEYIKDAQYKCACGASYKLSGTKKDIHVEVCSNCHPFYTGKDRILDTEGRVEKFKKKFNL